MKAYILSQKYGVVQIGHRVFQPFLGTSFETHRKGLKNLHTYDVPDVSMDSAIMALKKDAELYGVY